MVFADQFAVGGGQEFSFPFGAVLGFPGIGGEDEAQANAPGGHGFATGDDVEVAVDAFFDFLENRFAVVIIGDACLFILLRGVGVIGDGDFDGKAAFVAIGGRS